MHDLQLVPSRVRQPQPACDESLSRYWPEGLVGDAVLVKPVRDRVEIRSGGYLPAEERGSAVIAHHEPLRPVVQPE